MRVNKAQVHRSFFFCRAYHRFFLSASLPYFKTEGAMERLQFFEGKVRSTLPKERKEGSVQRGKERLL